MLSKLFSFLFVFKPKKSTCKVMTRKSNQSYIENEIRIRPRSIVCSGNNNCEDEEGFSKYFSNLKGLNVYEREISCYRRNV